MINLRRSIYIVVIALIAAFVTATFNRSYIFRRAGSKVPEVKIIQGADNNIDVYVSRAQIREEVAPVVIEEFLSRNRISSSEDGLKLIEFRDDGLLARYGFKRGDLVKEISGEKVNTKEEVIKVCERLESELLSTRSAKEVKVVLDRDGEDINMNFRIPEFVPEKVSYALRLEKRGRR